MWTFSLLKALALWVRLAPLLAVRLAVFASLALGAGLAAWTGAWAAFVMGPAHGQGGLALDPVSGALTGGVIAAVVLAIWQARRLAVQQALLIALISDLHDGLRLPLGPGQIGHARSAVAARFGSVADLQALARHVRSVTGVIPALAEGGGLLALPFLGRLAQGGLVDRVVLAHAYRARPENAWEAAHDALVLATQNGRDLLATAARLTAAGWAVTAALVLLLAQPLAGLSATWPGNGPVGAHVGAALLALALRAALVQPFLAACLWQMFQGLVAGQAPLGEWRGRLTRVSVPFRTLGEKALSWAPDGRGAA
ncbi:hypothetical protein [Rhodobacter calidifons]|uniref:Flp pilus assembly protein TadB n=1 Tax=Rhodobacter calidifons TaxID=2715277 RepID=A0ABX0G654_9RHOB|nr:hypothetical protein [Rhodobacter calidifons]NHB76745.1 hypothetical protein [Rhodobacter calidifons]